MWGHSLVPVRGMVACPAVAHYSGPHYTVFKRTVLPLHLQKGMWGALVDFPFLLLVIGVH